MWRHIPPFLSPPWENHCHQTHFPGLKGFCSSSWSLFSLLQHPSLNGKENWTKPLSSPWEHLLSSFLTCFWKVFPCLACFVGPNPPWFWLHSFCNASVVRILTVNGQSPSLSLSNHIHKDFQGWDQHFHRPVSFSELTLMDLPESYNGSSKHRHSLASEYLIYKGQNSMGAWPMPGRELGQIPLPVGPGEGGVSTHPSWLLTMDVVAEGSGKGVGTWGKRCVLENSTSS